MKRLCTIFVLMYVAGFSFNAFSSVVVLVKKLPEDSGFEARMESKVVELLTSRGVETIGKYSYLGALEEKIIAGLKKGKLPEKLSIPFGDFIAVCRVHQSKKGYFGTASLIDVAKGTVVGIKEFSTSPENLPDILASLIQNLLKSLPPEVGAPPAHPAEWKVVKVVAVGEMKGPDRPDIRRIAISIALRNAVEKAGYIQTGIRRVAGERKVKLTSASQRVTYRLLEERYKDGIFTVKIAAKVYVKKMYEEKEVTLPEGTTSVIFRIKGKGLVDWGKGYVEATGFGRYGKGNLKEEIARRSAFAEAVGNAFEILKGININEKENLGTFISKDSKRAFELSGVLSGAEVVSYKKVKGGMKVKVRIPLSHIRNVVLRYISAEVPSKSQREEKIKKVNLPAPGKKRVILDARGLKVRPVLLPGIKTTNGEKLHYSSVRFVKPEGNKVKKLRFSFRISAKGKVPSEVVINQRDAERIKKKMGNMPDVIILTDEVVGGTEG